MNWSEWREVARQLLKEGVPPSETTWGRDPEFDFSLSERTPVERPTIPKEFLEMGPFVAAARDPDRWSLLYRLVYRLNRENNKLLNIVIDPDVKRALELVKAVRRDIHKMHAFVRFKKIVIEGQDTYVAWHRTEHLIMELGAPFFMRRFGDKPWSIFSPDASAHWDLQNLTYGEGMPEHAFTHDDEFDEVWKTYYKSIFNPARLKLKAMRAEMSPKYWSSMPETSLIKELIRETPARLQAMAEAPQIRADVPRDRSLADLRKINQSCAICPWAGQATQTVFGAGNGNAEMMIVGEQPGNEEDLSGEAFVGPAGEVLNHLLKEVGILRENLYVTNAVKHFKWTPGDDGKQRIHKKPSGTDMHACKPWLEAEIAAVKPKVILALGVTAATSVLGRAVKISEERERPCRTNGAAEYVLVSWHPSAILRAFSSEDREKKMSELKADLARAFGLSRS